MVGLTKLNSPHSPPLKQQLTSRKSERSTGDSVTGPAEEQQHQMLLVCLQDELYMLCLNHHLLYSHASGLKARVAPDNPLTDFAPYLSDNDLCYFRDFGPQVQTVKMILLWDIMILLN